MADEATGAGQDCYDAHGSTDTTSPTIHISISIEPPTAKSATMQ